MKRFGAGFRGVGVAALAVAAWPAVAPAIVWNGNDPGRGVVNPAGLTDRPGIFNNVHVVFNEYGNVRGTSTYLANGWVLTARHVLQDGNYSNVIWHEGAVFDNGGQRHRGTQIVQIPDLADMILLRVGGDVNLPELKRSVISDDWNGSGRLVQLGGYGGHGWIGPGGQNFGIGFHRGYNVSFVNGSDIATATDGEQRLRDHGLLEAGAISGDSGSAILLLNGADSQHGDQERYTIGGTLGTSGGGNWGAWSSWSRTPGYARFIRDTVWGPEKTVNYTFNQTGTADLANMANWTPSEAGMTFPNKSGLVNVNNGGTVNFNASSNGGQAFDIDATSDWGAELWAGHNGTGTINVSGGNLNVGTWFVAGRGNGTGTINVSGGTVSSRHLVAGAFNTGTGTINVSGGTINLRDSVRVAEGGTGTLTQTGGTINVNFGGATTNDYDRVAIGQLAGSRGVYNLSGGSVNVKGDQGVADVNNDLPGGFNVGDAGRGLLNLSGTGAVNTRTLVVGRTGAGAAGAVRQTGGSMNVTAVDGAGATGENRIGGISPTDAAAYGSYDISGGTFAGSNNLQVGSHGVGTMTVRGTGVVTTNTYPSVGRFATGQGVLNVAGGSFTRNAGGGFLIVAERGAGTLNVSGTGVVNAGGDVAVGLAAGSSGAVNLNGGTLRAARVYGASPAATSRLSFDGGTLVATAGNVDLIAGLNSAVIQDGGATVNTNAHDVTISQSLDAPAGNGVGGVVLAAGGTNYLGEPLVRITGGGGIGATGVATINPTTGAVTGVNITNPGTNYTSPPTVELLGGGGSGATLAPAALAPNTSGGLDKIGLGTLTLAAANSYSGPTAVRIGRLLVNGSIGNGAVTVDAGATLGGTGSVGGFVDASGEVSPGNSAGELTLAGGARFRDDAVLRVELAGASSFDLLDAAGAGLTFDAGSVLDLDLLGGYVPAEGAMFDVLDFATSTGRFSELRLPALPGSLAWDAGALYTDGVLAVVPEPAAAGLMAFAAPVVLARRRRRVA